MAPNSPLAVGFVGGPAAGWSGGAPFMDAVWLSFALKDTRLVTMAFTTDHHEVQHGPSDRDHQGERPGTARPSRRFSDCHLGQRTEAPAPPDLVDINGIWVVSEQAAAILQRFDLGNGALYPVGLFRSDRKTPFPGHYHCWNFGNTKSALVASASKDLRPFGVAGVTWTSLGAEGRRGCRLQRGARRPRRLA